MSASNTWSFYGLGYTSPNMSPYYFSASCAKSEENSSSPSILNPGGVASDQGESEELLAGVAVLVQSFVRRHSKRLNFRESQCRLCSSIISPASEIEYHFRREHVEQLLGWIKAHSDASQGPSWESSPVSGLVSKLTLRAVVSPPSSNPSSPAPPPNVPSSSSSKSSSSSTLAPILAPRPLDDPTPNSSDPSLPPMPPLPAEIMASMSGTDAKKSKDKGNKNSASDHATGRSSSGAQEMEKGKDGMSQSLLFQSNFPAISRTLKTSAAFHYDVEVFASSLNQEQVSSVNSPEPVFDFVSALERIFKRPLPITRPEKAAPQAWLHPLLYSMMVADPSQPKELVRDRESLVRREAKNMLFWRSLVLTHHSFFHGKLMERPSSSSSSPASASLSASTAVAANTPSKPLPRAPNHPPPVRASQSSTPVINVPDSPARTVRRSYPMRPDIADLLCLVTRINSSSGIPVTSYPSSLAFVSDSPISFETESPGVAPSYPALTFAPELPYLHHPHFPNGQQTLIKAVEYTLWVVRHGTEQYRLGRQFDFSLAPWEMIMDKEASNKVKQRAPTLMEVTRMEPCYRDVLPIPDTIVSEQFMTPPSALPVVRMDLSDPNQDFTIPLASILADIEAKEKAAAAGIVPEPIFAKGKKGKMQRRQYAKEGPKPAIQPPTKEQLEARKKAPLSKGMRETIDAINKARDRDGLKGRGTLRVAHFTPKDGKLVEATDPGSQPVDSAEEATKDGAKSSAKSSAKSKPDTTGDTRSVDELVAMIEGPKKKGKKVKAKAKAKAKTTANATTTTATTPSNNNNNNNNKGQSSTATKKASTPTPAQSKKAQQNAPVKKESVKTKATVKPAVKPAQPVKAKAKPVRDPTPEPSSESEAESEAEYEEEEEAEPGSSDHEDSEHEEEEAEPTPSIWDGVSEGFKASLIAESVAKIWVNTLVDVLEPLADKLSARVLEQARKADAEEQAAAAAASTVEKRRTEKERERKERKERRKAEAERIYELLLSEAIHSTSTAIVAEVWVPPAPGSRRWGPAGRTGGVGRGSIIGAGATAAYRPVAGAVAPTNSASAPSAILATPKPPEPTPAPVAARTTTIKPTYSPGHLASARGSPSKPSPTLPRNGASAPAVSPAPSSAAGGASTASAPASAPSRVPTTAAAASSRLPATATASASARVAPAHSKPAAAQPPAPAPVASSQPLPSSSAATAPTPAAPAGNPMMAMLGINNGANLPPHLRYQLGAGRGTGAASASPASSGGAVPAISNPQPQPPPSQTSHQALPQQRVPPLQPPTSTSNLASNAPGPQPLAAQPQQAPGPSKTPTLTPTGGSQPTTPLFTPGLGGEFSMWGPPPSSLTSDSLFGGAFSAPPPSSSKSPMLAAPGSQPARPLPSPALPQGPPPGLGLPPGLSGMHSSQNLSGPPNMSGPPGIMGAPGLAAPPRLPPGLSRPSDPPAPPPQMETASLPLHHREHELQRFDFAAFSGSASIPQGLLDGELEPEGSSSPLGDGLLATPGPPSEPNGLSSSNGGRDNDQMRFRFGFLEEDE